MKQTFLFIALTLTLAGPSHAADACPTTIKEAMKVMGPAFQQLGMGAGDVTRYPSLIPLASSVRSGAAQAIAFLPAKIVNSTALTPEQKEAAFKEYRKDLTDLVEATFVLEDGLRTNDTGKVAAAMKAIADLRKSGHIDFK